MNGRFLLGIAICIAAIAAYFSIIGLATLFAAAIIPVIIMGAALEVAKLATAAWLHQNWNTIPFLLKSYFTAAVVVLMFITSMGIFGFLSKAHIEQTGNISSQVAKLEFVVSQIEQVDIDIASLQDESSAISNKDSNVFAQIQQQIDQEQANIDRIYARLQPTLGPLESQLNTINARILQLQQESGSIDDLVKSNQIVEVQKIIGVKQDGDLGSQTRAAIEEFKISSQAEIERLTAQLPDIQSKILEIKSTVEPLVAQSNELIAKLRDRITFSDNTETQGKTDSIKLEIEELNTKKLALMGEKFELESQISVFEVEVGPLKYIAEFLYGESDTEIIEKSIRWVILIIIFVFDPLAVLLVIAASMTMSKKAPKRKYTRRAKPNNNDHYDVSKTFDINKKGDIVEKNTPKRKYTRKTKPEDTNNHYDVSKTFDINKNGDIVEKKEVKPRKSRSIKYFTKK
jgi:hypothetical protein